MLVRICLIISLLCAGATVYISHDKVQARKDKVEDDGWVDVMSTPAKPKRKRKPKKKRPRKKKQVELFNPF